MELEEMRMKIDKMRRIVQEADELEFLYRHAEQRARERQHRAKAGEVLALLRRHIPADHLREVEEFLSSGSGCDSLCMSFSVITRERHCGNTCPPSTGRRSKTISTEMLGLSASRRRCPRRA